jgi:hypothetical protein
MQATQSFIKMFKLLVVCKVKKEAWDSQFFDEADSLYIKKSLGL